MLFSHLLNENNVFSCLLVNSTPNLQVVQKIPHLVKPPCQVNLTEQVKETEISQERKDGIKSNLRLEGKDEIIQLCSNYSGDKLTYILADKHYIPTPNIPQSEAIIL